MKKITIFIFCIAVYITGTAQSGSFIATITPVSGQKTITVSYSKSVFKFDDTYGYWFINPHSGARHLQLAPPEGYGGGDVAFITMNERSDDLDLMSGTSNDSDQVLIENNVYSISAPEYDPKIGDDNKPMHIHFSVFSASEVSFTITGIALVTTKSGNSGNPVLANINANGHFYREPKYAKSGSLQGCDCDATIYGTTYSKTEYSRTMSGCENAFSNKVFDAVQKAFAPLYALSYEGSGQPAAGQLIINPLPGHVNTNVPVKERLWCSTDYFHMRSTSLFAEQEIYSNDDVYGVRFIQMPDLQTPGGGLNSTLQAMQSLQQQMKDGKITPQEYLKQLSELSNNKGSGTSESDIQKSERELNLYLSLIINPVNGGASEMTIDGKATIMHRVPGSPFELYSPLIKDLDGNWVADKYYIYLGKFSIPVTGKNQSGRNAELTAPTYPPNAPKLAVYNIVIKMEGGKALIDKALAAMDVSALEALITKQ